MLLVGLRTCCIYLDDARGQLARQNLSLATKKNSGRLKGFVNSLVTKPLLSLPSGIDER
jgi:hypothetical protein